MQSARGITGSHDQIRTKPLAPGEGHQRWPNLQTSNDFIAHLARKSVLRDPQVLAGGLNARGGEGLGDIDWVDLTKLTTSAFADVG